MRFILIPLICLMPFTTFAQKTRGKYVKAAGSGCRIWDYNYSPKDSIVWKGDCIKGYGNGFGTATWSRNSKEVGKYIGYLKKGKLNGQGKYLLPNNYDLEGVFFNGFLQGNGKINDRAR